MPILILNQYYPPDRSATAEILERLVKVLASKHHTIVLSGRPSYLILNKQKWKLLYAEKSKNLKVFRVGSTAFSRYSIIKRISNYLTYLALSFPLALLIRSDIIFTMTDPPLAGLIGAIAAKVRNKPFIYYIQDLHPDMAIAAGMIRSGKISNLWQLIHMFVLKSATRLIVIGDDMKERILSKGISPNKISVIRHGTPVCDSVCTIDYDFLKQIKGKYTFTFMHAGNIGNYGAWEKIISAIKMINDENIGYIFVGEGQKKKDLIKLCYGITNIDFYPYQPKEKLDSVLKAGDVHIITIKNNLEGLVVPSKIYSVLGAHKPILGICPVASDTAKIIKQFRCGIIADPDSVDSIASAILKFSTSRKNLSVYEKKSRIAADYFNQNRLIERLSQEIVT